MSNDIRELARRELNFFQTLKAVAWGFFGVRKSTGFSKDTATINPVHIIIAGLIGGAVLVGSILVMVRVAITSLS